MQVIKSTYNHFCIILSPKEIEAFNSDILTNTNITVKDTASSIRWGLEAHIEYLRTIHKL